MKRRRKFTEHYRYFLSYSILILLFFALTLPIAFNYMNLARKNIAGEYQAQIDRNAAAAEEEIDALISLFRRLVEADGIEGTLVQTHQNEIDYLEIRRTQEIFSSLQRAYPLITDYTLIGKNGLIYFNFRSFDNRSFIREIFDRVCFSVEGTGSLEEFFEQQGKDVGYARVYSCDQGSYPALLRRAKLLSVYSFGIQETATVYFSLSLEDLTSYIVPSAMADDIFFAFYQEEDREVYTNFPDDANREEYVAFKTQTPLAEGTLVFFYPEAMIVSNVQPLVNILWLNIAAALGIGLLLAVYFSWRAHRPVRRLTQIVQEAAKTQRAAGDSELAYVAAEFGKLHSMLRENGQLLEEQRKMLRRTVLESAVFGHIHTATSQGYFEELMPDFPKTYQMALFTIDASCAMDVVLSQQFLLEKRIQEYFSAEYVLPLAPGNLLLIMPVREGESLRLPLENFFRAMGDTMPTVQAALSNVHAGMMELNEAYLELLHIFRMGNQGRVLELSDVGVSHPSGFDYHVFQYLYQAILYGEREEIAIQFNRLRMLTDQGQPRDSDSMENWPGIRQFLLSVLLRIKREYNSRLCDVTVPSLSGNQPLEEYFHAAELCAEEMAMRLKVENRNLLQKNLQETVMAYINENLGNPSFYLKTVTDQFHIGEKNVQAIVRESTGTSFSEYVEKQRLCLARQLLTDTELSVAEIAEQVGFTAYNTFYKAFKRGYDQSPTEFRAVLRKAAEKKAGS